MVKYWRKGRRMRVWKGVGHEGGEREEGVQIKVRA
jgi:hypothetical protein